MLLVKHIKIHQTYKTVDFHIFHCIHTYYRIFLSSAQSIIRFQLSSKELCLVAFSESSMHRVNWSKQYLKLYAFDSMIHPRSISVVVFVESFLILPQAPRRGSQRLCSLTFNAFEKQRKERERAFWASLDFGEMFTGPRITVESRQIEDWETITATWTENETGPQWSFHVFSTEV